MIIWLRPTVNSVMAVTIFFLVVASLSIRALAQGDVSEMSNVAGWSVVAVGNDNGVVCTIARMNRQKLVLNVVAPSKHRVLAFMLNGSEIGWQLKLGSEYDVAYVIDDNQPVAAKARAETETAIAIPFALDFWETEPLRRGRTIEFRAAQGTFWFNLAGSAKALDALSACVRRYGGVGGTSANPFEGTPAEPSTASEPEDVSATATSAAPGGEREVDAAIATAKELRMVRAIFANDPSAETELKEQLRSVLRDTPEAEKPAKAMEEVRAFLAIYVESAMKTAPGDALAKMARHDRDVMQQLRSRPDVCAAFFKASGRGGLGFLPPDLRLAQGEIYADLIEASLSRPVASSDVATDEQVVTWMAQAYADAGYPAEDLARFTRITTMDDREVCRLANQYMVAVTSLSDAQIGKLYRTIAQQEP